MLEAAQRADTNFSYFGYPGYNTGNYLVNRGPVMADHGIACARDFLWISYPHTYVKDISKTQLVQIKPWNQRFAPLGTLSDT